jgi:hypothetical protein
MVSDIKETYETLEFSTNGGEIRKNKLAMFLVMVKCGMMRMQLQIFLVLH